MLKRTAFVTNDLARANVTVTQDRCWKVTYEPDKKGLLLEDSLENSQEFSYPSIVALLKSESAANLRHFTTREIMH